MNYDDGYDDCEYPYLEIEDVRQALEYSAALAESEYHLALRPSA